MGTSVPVCHLNNAARAKVMRYPDEEVERGPTVWFLFSFWGFSVPWRPESFIGTASTSQLWLGIWRMGRKQTARKGSALQVCGGLSELLLLLPTTNERTSEATFSRTFSELFIKESPQGYLQEFFQVVTKMQGGFYSFAATPFAAHLLVWNL